MNTYGTLSSEYQCLVRLIAYVLQKYKHRSINVWGFDWSITEYNDGCWMVVMTHKKSEDKFHIRYIMGSQYSFYRVFFARGATGFDVKLEEFLIDD